MGKIYEAARRGEASRVRRDPDGLGEPAVVLDLTAAVGREPSIVQTDRATADEAGPTVSGGGREAARAPDPCLVAITDPGSRAAEELRAVRSAARLALESRGLRTLLVTSPGRGEGKSLVSANLALLLAAEIGRRALLVDADLRKPTAARLLGVRATPGLCEVARPEIPWRDAVVRAPWNELDVIPAGSRTGKASELLGGPGMRAFLAEVREVYDFVVIDAPPVLPVTDAMVLGGLADAVLIVARAEWTPRDALVEAIRRLGAAAILGVVLNAVPDDPFVRRDYYTY